MITLEIERLEYNSKWSPSTITVTTKPSSEFGTCRINGNDRQPPEIESATDNKNWKAEYPSDYNSLSLSFNPSGTLFTCGNYAFTWTLNPKITLQSGSYVTIEFDDKLDITSASSGSLTNFQVDVENSKITFKTSSLRPSNEAYSFTISGIKLPPTGVSFNTTVATFTAISAEEPETVHRGYTSKTSASKEIIPLSKIITLDSATRTVGEGGDLAFNIAGKCGTVVNPKYQITIPSIFSADGNTCTDKCELVSSSVIRLTPGVDLVYDASQTLSFKLWNPVSAIATTDSDQFTITVSDTDGNEAFEVTAALENPVTFAHGYLTSFAVEPETKKVGEECPYTFTLGIKHKVPVGGVIRLTMPTEVGWLGSASVTAKGKPYTPTYEAPYISFIINEEWKDETIDVVVNKLRNPLQTGTFSGFKAETLEDISGTLYKIDVSPEDYSIDITTAGNADVTCTPSNFINFVENEYTVTFKSTFDIPQESEQKYLNVKIPSEVGGCSEPNKYTPTFNEGTNTYKLTITDDPIRDLSFTMNCKNPATTKETGPFILTLYTTPDNLILEGKDTVQTTKGAEFSTYSVSNDKRCPRCETSCSFELNRESTVGIKLITIYSTKIIDSTTLCEVTTPSSPPSSCTYDGTKWVIKFTSETSSKDFTIINIPAKNPDTVDAASKVTFSIKTYTSDDENKNSIVNEHDNMGKLTVDCDFPCDTCEVGLFTNCTSCFKGEVSGKYYYHYSDLDHCGLLDEDDSCGTGYLKDKTKKKCSLCHEKCVDCIGKTDNCTECRSPPFLYKGECYSKCMDGTYVPDGEKTCYDCKDPCTKCTKSATACDECVLGMYLYNKGCVDECPVGTYPTLDMKCLACDAECHTCSGTAKTCTSCIGDKYLFNSKCITSTECTFDKMHVADSSSNKCLSCSSPCVECVNEASKCTKCADPRVLHDYQCLDYCPAPYYKSGSQCLRCDPLCNSCVGTSNHCTSCVEGAYLEVGTAQCVTSCKSNYYISGSSCIPCDSSCNTCFGNSITCTSCHQGSYLYKNKCVGSCPDGTFTQGNECTKCSPTCATCSGTETTCTSCPSNLYLNVNTCVASCPSGKTAVQGICTPCDGQCATCSGTTDFCLSCKGESYVYGGKCYTECPNGTIGTSSTSGKACVACEQGCDVCVWADSTNQTYTQNCLKCSKDYKLLDKKCYYVCPDGYVASSDGLSCIKEGQPEPPNNNTTNNETTPVNETKAEYLPFPHLIGSVLVGAITAGRQSQDGQGFIVTNLVVVMSYVTLSSYAFQGLFAYSSDELILALISGGVLALQVLLNWFFLIAYKKSIASDTGFISWSNNHGCAKASILTMSTLASMQTSRLFYSRFLGFDTFSASFANARNAIDPINCFSLFQLLLTHCAIAVVNAFSLFKFTWGTNLYVSMIEALVLSVFMIILLCFDMKGAKEIKEKLEEVNHPYNKVNDQSNMNQSVTEPPKPFDEENFRKQILESVFREIGLSSRRSIRTDQDHDDSFLMRSPFSTQMKNAKPERRRSTSPKTRYSKEKDSKKSHSYPCSPKTAKSKEVPLRRYGVEEETPIPPQELPDNVYSDAVPPRESKMVSLKPMVEAGAQTPPFKKLEAFKTHMKVQNNKKKRKGKKLFEQEHSPSPLEVIQEAPDDNEELGNRENGMEFKEEIIEKADASISPISESKKDGMIRTESPELKSVVVVKDMEMPKEEEKQPEIKEEEKQLEVKEEEKKAEVKEEEAKRPEIKEEKKVQAANLAEEAIEKSKASKVLEPPPVRMEKLGSAQAADEVSNNSILPPIEPVKKDLLPPVQTPLKKSEPLPEITKFEDSPPSLADEDKSPPSHATRAIHSPPQNAPEAPDELLSKPLNPIDESMLINTGKFDLPQVNSKVNVNTTEKPIAAEAKKGETVNKTLTNTHKIPDVFEDNDGFKFSAANLKATPKPEEKSAKSEEIPAEEVKKIPKENSSLTLHTEKVEEPQYINEEELMGSFERDPVDDYIIIRENEEGFLVDLRGRRVNKLGYLIDKDGNVINRKGELMFRKEEIENELGEDNEYPIPIVQDNPLFREEPSDKGKDLVHEITKVEEMEKNLAEPIENKVEEIDNRSRKSASLNSLMEDTPSNYNIQNQRYDDPLDAQKQRTPMAGRPYPLAQKPVEYEPPSEGDVKMAKVYGGKPRGPPKRPRRHKVKNKSANKREVEKLFKVADKVSGYASDAEGKMDNTSPLADVSATNIKSEAENIRRPVPALEEEKSSPPRVKPQTARSNLRSKKGEDQHRRAKSRKATNRDLEKNDELEKAYGQNIEDMFLYSDVDDGMSMGSIAPSNLSRASNKALAPRIKGLENIYLQRLESSTKHQKKLARREKSKGKAKKSKIEGQGSESDRDEIASLLSANYEAMQKQFKKQVATGNPAKRHPEGVNQGLKVQRIVLLLNGHLYELYVQQQCTLLQVRQDKQDGILSMFRCYIFWGSLKLLFFQWPNNTKSFERKSAPHFTNSVMMSTLPLLHATCNAVDPTYFNYIVMLLLLTVSFSCINFEFCERRALTFSTLSSFMEQSKSRKFGFCSATLLSKASRTFLCSSKARVNFLLHVASSFIKALFSSSTLVCFANRHAFICASNFSDGLVPI
eukprot:TRINITY_DN666_c0_g1_i1.p1 TRINITY_DN666_c0_g1~~TRINITY_DN666_c0_g1_i1.p1  ORF type:complete len:2608 (+),score=224.05 TRINITY_DN666_c0_g1_i1:10363-18186(+)